MEGMAASIQTESWFFRLGQEVGVNSLRFREGGFPFDPGKNAFFDPGRLWEASIQRRCLLRFGMLYLQKYVSKIKLRAWVLNPRPFDPALVGVSSG